MVVLNHDPAVSSDLDLFIADLQGRSLLLEILLTDNNYGEFSGTDLSTLNFNLDVPVLPEGDDVLSSPFLQLVPRIHQPTFEWLSFYPGCNSDAVHCPDTFRTPISADCHFSYSSVYGDDNLQVQTPKAMSLQDLRHLETECHA